MFGLSGITALKYILAAIALTGAGSTAIALTTRAIFTDLQPVGSNAFTTGTLDITTAPTSALLTASNMGSLQMRYAIQRSAMDTDGKALRSSLRLRIGLQSGGGCDFPYYNADGSTTTLGDDVQLYEGLGFAGTATDTVGSSSQGSQAGDRTLNSGGSEVLCFSMVLPTSAGNSLQNATTTVTFDFASEQTINN
jgi:hypothetical protein